MSKNLLRFRVAIMLVGSMLFVLLGGSRVIAQGVTTSSINGVVSDDKGAVLPGATVVAIHTPSGTRYGITTNSAGRYTFPAVRIGGPYQMTVSFVGFQDVTREIGSADLGTPVVANFTLTEQGKQLSEIVVRAPGSIINSERTGAATNFKRESFERLPTLNRNFQDFSNLTPQSSGGFSFGGRSNLYNNFSIDGATSNNVFGLSAVPGGQSNANPVSVDAIQELSVQLSPYDVSQGSFTGAGVNAVTRSGTNNTEGSVYYFTKNQSFAGKSSAGTELTDLQRGTFKYENWGGRLGGAIIKNKLFYFVNAEYEKSTSPGAVNQPTAQQAEELNRLRDFLVTPNNGKSWTFDPGTYSGYNLPQQSVKLLAKIDWNINDNNKFTIRYNQLNAYRDVSISGSGGFATGPAGGRANSSNTFPFSRSNYRIKNDLYSIFAELNSTFGKGKFSNDLQVGYSAFRDIRQSAGGSEVPSFPTVDILASNGSGTNLTSFGPDPFTVNNRLDQDIIQINDKFDMFLGNHTITLGTANELYKFYNVFTQVINGVYEYNSVSDFINNATNPSPAGTPFATSNYPRRYYQQYAAVEGNPTPAADWSATQFGFYAQDVYAGIKNFRLTVGIRADIPTYPKGNYLKNSYVDSLSAAGVFGGEQIHVEQLPKTSVLWSPRVGFNWDILGDKTLQLRGGTGIFTGRVPFVWLSNQLSNNGVFFGVTNPGIKGTGSPVVTNEGFPFNPNVITPTLQPFTGRPLTPTFTTNSTVSNFKFPQVFRSNLAIDKTLGGGFVATLEAIYTKDINAIYIRDANLAAPVGALAGDGRNLYGAANGAANVAAPNDRRLNDRIDQALVLDNTSKGYAASLTFQLQKTTGRLQGSAAYTYTDSKDINAQNASTAGSLYTGNPYVSDPNYPNLSYSNAWVPNRVVGFVSYRFDYGKMFATTISGIYQGSSAGNFSYTYSGNPNSDGVSADLIYVPRNQNEILLTTTSPTDTRTSQQIWDQLNAYIEQDPYLSKRRGQYAERNGALLPWVNSLNLRVLQDFYVKTGSKGKRNTVQLSLEVFNVLNLLDNNWGTVKAVTRPALLNFVGYETPHTATAPTTGRPIYSFATNSDNTPLATSYYNNITVSNGQTTSRWQLQLGARYIFN